MPCMVVHCSIQEMVLFMLPRPQHGLESIFSLAANPTRITLNTINHALVAPPRSGRGTINRPTHITLSSPAHILSLCLLSCLRQVLPAGKYLTIPNPG